MMAVDAVFVSEQCVKLDKEGFKKAIEENIGEIILNVATFDNHLLIPLLHYMYSFALQTYPEHTITILPRMRPTITSGNFEIIELEPLNVDPADRVVFGGTFDRMHYGHKLLITAACLLCRKDMMVGVVQNPAKKTLAEMIEPFPNRLARMIKLCYQVNENLRITVAPLEGRVGPAGTAPDIDLLVLTEDTISGGEEVNRERRNNGLKEVAFAVLKLINQNNGKPISSTLLRQAEKGALP